MSFLLNISIKPISLCLQSLTIRIYVYQQLTGFSSAFLLEALGNLMKKYPLDDPKPRLIVDGDVHC